MWYIDPVPNDSGAYSPPQSTPFDSAIPLTDEQSDMLVQHNGFVAITREPDPEMEGSTVTVVPNTEAWEAWKSSLPPQPEPEPTWTFWLLWRGWSYERVRAGPEILPPAVGRRPH